MKIVQYLHGSNWLPAAVTAYSVQKNGTKGAKFVLFSTDSDVLSNIYIHKVFDTVEAPKWGWKALWEMDLCWEHNHPYHDGHIPAWPSDFRKYALTKYGCFLHEPGDVLFLDNDILCVGDISGVMPKHGKEWAARYWEYRGSPRLNGGVLSHVDGWDASDFIRPLEDQNAMREAFQIHRLDDEACATWSMIRHGISDLYQLPGKYNQSIATATPLARLLHYNSKEKPWLGKYLNSVREYYELWTELAIETCEHIGYNLNGEGVPERWKWPHRLGEWNSEKKPLKWRNFT